MSASSGLDLEPLGPPAIGADFYRFFFGLGLGSPTKIDKTEKSWCTYSSLSKNPNQNDAVC